MAKKRDRTLSKLIDFPDEKAKQKATVTAAKAGKDLKNWIQDLILKNI